MPEETVSVTESTIRYTKFTMDEVLDLLGVEPREGGYTGIAIYEPVRVAGGPGRPWQLVVSQSRTAETLHAGPANTWIELDGDQRYDERGRPVIDDD